MLRIIHPLGMLILLSAPTSATASQPFSLDNARACIQLNKDLALAREQMLETEQEKAHLASKVHYLEGAIEERRSLINRLDQRNTQSNNENYNQLVSQYEDLSEERQDTIDDYNQTHDRHVVQHDSVVRLEQRFSSECLYEITLTEDIYTEACKFEDVRWCKAFSFN